MKRGVSAFLFLAVFICTSSSAQAQAPQNLLENEFFEEWRDETNATDWQLEKGGAEAYERSSYMAVSGEYSAYTESSKEIILGQEAYMEEGTDYHQEVWVKGNGDFSVGIQYPDDVWTGYGEWQNASNKEWTKATYKQSPTTTGQGQIRIRMENISNGLWIGAAWLGTKGSPKDWLVEGNESDENNVTEYMLNITTLGKGETTPSEDVYFYEENETVSVEAAPDDGWEFVEW
ncbi:MAG: hypothetical protein ACLFTY_00715, partial [Candidatus Aenigmatarchaeota archaeon]